LPSFHSIWWDASASERRAGAFTFFGALKNAGGQLDQISMDSEEGFDGPDSRPPNPNTTNMSKFWRCNKAQWTALQNDPRFPPVQRALRDMGFVANYSSPSWLFDEMSVNARSVENWLKPMYDPAPGRGTNRLIWDAVDKQRISVYYQTAFGDAAAHYFPGTLVANDDLFQNNPRFANNSMAWNNGFWAGHLVGHGSNGVGAQAPQLYFSALWTCDGPNPDAGCPPAGPVPSIDQGLHGSAGVPFGTFERSGFNFMRLHCSAVRGMVLANPAAPVRPWLDYKSYASTKASQLPDGPTDHYQERLLHMFLSGIDTFYYFNPWSGLIGGTRATTADNQLLSSLLLELDSRIGCQDRH
jgi:hypothetical protein